MATASRLRPYADESSLERAGGHRIDFSRVAGPLVAGTIIGRSASRLILPVATKLLISSIMVDNNVAIVVSNNHGLAIGDRIVIEGTGVAYIDGVRVVTEVVDNMTYRVAVSGQNTVMNSNGMTWRHVAVGMLETDASRDDPAATQGGYSVLVGGVVYENLLPDASGNPKRIPQALKDELRLAGCTFKFVEYRDSRA